MSDIITKITLDRFQQISSQAADFLSTLANSNRLIILSYLLEKEAYVGELVEKLDITQSAISQHLSRMRAEGLISTRRDKQQIFYTIKDIRVTKALRATYEVFCLNKY